MPELIGKSTTAAGPNPNEQFGLRFKVIELDDAITSQNADLSDNPDYPQGLQPRLRDRAASKAQIRKIAGQLQPDAILFDTRALDRGSMIVGKDNAVECGNGRTIALKVARADFPNSWREYQKALKDVVSDLGIAPIDLKKFKSPILVRENVKNMAPDERREFAKLCNQSAVLTHSPLEQAIQDSESITDNALASLQVGDSQTIDQALKSPSNRVIVDQFLNSVPETEQAAILDNQSNLNQIGLQRVKAAMFAKVFPGASGQRLTSAFFESIDPGVKTIENSIFDSLPKIAKAEGLARSGQRADDLAIGEDLAKAIDILARLKQQGMSVSDFLSQTGFLEKELTPDQEKILAYLDEVSRSRKRQREFFKAHAEAVIAAPPPNQGAFFDDVTETKGDILNRTIEAERKEAGGAELGLFKLIEERERSEAFSRNTPQAVKPKPEATTIATVREELAKPVETPKARKKRVTGLKPGPTKVKTLNQDGVTLSAVRMGAEWSIHEAKTPTKANLVKRVRRASDVEKEFRRRRRTVLKAKGVKRPSRAKIVTTLKAIKI